MAIEDVRPAKRITRTYLGSPLYVIMTYDEDGGPYAIQCSISSEMLNRDQQTLSNIDTIAMAVTLNLREYPLDYVVVRLLETARGQHTIAGILADVLMEYGQG